MNMAFGEIPTAQRAAHGAAREQVTLTRDCEGILVPAGTPITFTLNRFDGSWKIVNKSFVHTSGEPPAH